MALDYGRKAIGLAVSDETWSRVMPGPVLDSTVPMHILREKLVDNVAKYDIGAFIVGWPIVPRTGMPGEQCLKVAKFVEELNMKEMPHVPWDEQYSTAIVENDLMGYGITVDRKHRRKRNGAYNPRGHVIIDNLAAKVILQSFADWHETFSGPQEHR
mmetsp:Transcript_5153/g.11370  ORF Transcript_5153/g.11370 Transcript_5153/m.11370 type:complete len:157 (-) Transcript_5153:2977-3447(-)